MCHSLDQKASVGTTSGTGFVLDDSSSGNGYVWIKLNDLIVFSCYWSPNTTLAEYEIFLGDLDQAIRARGDTRLIFAGDFNAWNVEWSSRADNPRGELLSDLAVSLDLILSNVGDTPTFVRGEATSIIDVAFSRGVGVYVWSVLDELNLSDHAYITFSIDPRAPTRTLDGLKLTHHPVSTLAGLSRNLTVNLSTATSPQGPSPFDGMGKGEIPRSEQQSHSTTTFSNPSMPLRSPWPGGRSPMYWWSDHIADLRSTALSLRRTYQSLLRRHGPEGSAEAKANFATAIRDLRRAIQKSKEKGWWDLCAQIYINPWNQPYKLVMKKFGDGSSRPASKGCEQVIADHLFPAAPVTDSRLGPHARASG
ncbi:unnamed protein product [Macrosiphum euphorbiae]|uniref:Endonuclease/exonuclease/phosphatase domain-containing protein n=1 Tax=Macrosiphum euphorbiae TaxID=13131 RepID=A0AAV0WLC1_9HEMI|nr:unnamed protein product [Macrosiphum euphorbiae]